MVTEVQIAELTADLKQNRIAGHGRYRTVQPDAVLEAPLIQSGRADVTPMHWHSVFGGSRNPAHKDIDSNATLAIRVSLQGTLKILQPVSAEPRR